MALFPALAIFFTLCFEKMLPARRGDHIFANQSGAFGAENQLSGPPSGSKNTDVGNFFAPSVSF